MSVAKVIEISAESQESFEDAIRRGIKTAGKSIHGIEGAWVKSQKVIVKDDKITAFRVELKLTFVLD
jgi:flavin-binding protein dodecin